ncbi:hypothetical protein [Hymenobacter sp. BT730]|uniref:hypothetical protein n=1 Tax=Hymenobacter sp. BT730 TaxID=3063332 RepID=UPI0026DF53DE|nr:hypothetical protein [Hymenobacter sp. BT730]
MKKLIMLLGSAMLLTFFASAQTEKGTVMLGLSGGNLFYAHDNDTHSKYTNWSVSLYPTAGIFLADNFLLGSRLNLGYNRYSQETSYSPYFRSNKTTSFNYGLGAFGRYYLPSTSKHRFFAELGADLMHSRSRQVIRDSQQDPNEARNNNKENSLGFHGSVGYNYFFAPNLALEASVGYHRTNLGQAYSGGNLRGQLGLSIFLQKRQPAPQP